MQSILPSEFKRQMILMVEGSPHVVEDMHTSGTAQTRHRLHTRLRHLITGRLVDRVFAENERVQVAPLETRRVTYSYAQADSQVFIDIQTFDELEFSNAQLGERHWFLKENEEYKVLRLDGRLLDIVLPPQIPLKVVDTAPPARGGLNTSWKEAKLETGLQIMVPLFIANGDVIRVDTVERSLLGQGSIRGIDTVISRAGSAVFSTVERAAGINGLAFLHGIISTLISGFAGGTKLSVWRSPCGYAPRVDCPQNRSFFNFPVLGWLLLLFLWLYGIG